MLLQTPTVAAFDAWIRGRFVELNTGLEERYRTIADRDAVAEVDDPRKAALLAEGRAHVVAVLAEGSTDEGLDAAYDLLGNVGLYMAACRRHELTNPDRETRSPLREASALAMQIGAHAGVAPRFATAHLSIRNRAVDGRARRFTDLEDERLFLDLNTSGILAYQRAADALVRILPSGISAAPALELLQIAATALAEVEAANARLAAELDVTEFFHAVRPYYKPFRVGLHVYRGANAGDFAGINVIDLLTGLCSAQDHAYGQLLVDKLLFMHPEDQALLRDCLRRPNLLDAFLDAADAGAAGHPWFAPRARALLAVLDAHGRTAVQHHDVLVERFIVGPAGSLSEQHLRTVTASGPPLPVLLAGLVDLRDRRAAVARQDLATRHDDVARLRALVAGS